MMRESMSETTWADERWTSEAPSLYDRAHLWMISIVHDTIYRLLFDPRHLLEAAGLKKSQVALEVGCGRGFFTLPAVEIVGAQGRLYSIDINPAAVERVGRMVEERGVANFEVYLADAAKTGIDAESVDVAFLFGILRSLRDLGGVLLEMHRVLKARGLLAVERSSWSETRLLDAVAGGGLFRFVSREGRVYKFEKLAGVTAKDLPIMLNVTHQGVK